MALTGLLVLPALAQAQEPATTDPFLDLAAVSAKAPSGPTLFFPLGRPFEECLPLMAACPGDSSSLVVVPAAARTLVWTPEGTPLDEVPLDTRPIRPIGTPPPRPESARYLVPVVDARGEGLIFAGRRLDAGLLVPFDAGAPEPPEGGDVVPVLAGPLLGGAAPSGTQAGPIFEAPVIVDAAALDGATPAVLVRRAAPSRVAFGLRPDPAWGMDVGYVALLDETGTAVVARHEGRIGVAVGTPGGEPVTIAGPDGGLRTGTKGQEGLSPLALLAGATGALVLLAVATRRLFSRRS